MISDSVKALIALAGIKQGELAQGLGIAPQSVANKMQRNSWSAKDLAAAAEYVGGRLAFILPNGQQIFITDEKKSPDE